MKKSQKSQNTQSQKPQREQFKKTDHKHDHVHPLNSFFECCLTDQPAPISERIQKLRQKKLRGKIKITTIHPDQKLIVKPDMIVGDLIAAYPQIKNELEEIHPLGLLSPTLNQTTLEIFLADFPLNLKLLCQKLTKIANHD